MQRKTTTTHLAEPLSGSQSKTRCPTAAALALLLVLTAGLPARAVEGEAEVFRAELLEVVSVLGEATQLVPELTEPGRVGRLEKQFQGLDTESLSKLSRAATADGVWQDSLERLRWAADKARPAEGFGEPAATEEDGEPDYSAACGDDRPAANSMQLALILSEVLEGLEITAQSFCDASGSGDVDQENRVVCVLTAGLGEARLIAGSVYENFGLCSDDIDSAEITAAYQLADRIDTVVELNLDSQVSTRAGQDSLDDLASEVQVVETKLAMVQADVTTLTAGVANVQAELDDVQVRVTDTQLGVDDLETRVSDIELSVDDLRIEVQDLADTTHLLAATLDDFIDLSQSFEALNLQILIEGDLERRGTAAVSLFQLPAAVGGYLELAREIVITTIEANQAVGQAVGDADKSLSDGDLLFNAGAYRDAYLLYREAYHQATGRPGS